MASPTLPGPQKITIEVNGAHTPERLAKLLFQLGETVKKILGTDDYTIGFGDIKGN